MHIHTEGMISVVGYFDHKTFVEQLDPQAMIVAKNEWPLNTADVGNNLLWRLMFGRSRDRSVQ
jgi:hypothetical protein